MILLYINKNITTKYCIDILKTHTQQREANRIELIEGKRVFAWYCGWINSAFPDNNYIGSFQAFIEGFVVAC